MVTDKSQLKDLEYIGDGVYAGFDGYHIWIWTSNGITESSPIALEPEVFNSLAKYATSHWKTLQQLEETSRDED